jgi:hypothetical protein
MGERIQNMPCVREFMLYPPTTLTRFSKQFLGYASVSRNHTEQVVWYVPYHVKEMVYRLVTEIRTNLLPYMHI